MNLNRAASTLAGLVAAEIIAHAGAKADMQARGGDQVTAVRATLGSRADGAVPTLPTRFVSGTGHRL